MLTTAETIRRAYSTLALGDESQAARAISSFKSRRLWTPLVGRAYLRTKVLSFGFTVIVATGALLAGIEAASAITCEDQFFPTPEPRTVNDIIERTLGLGGSRLLLNWVDGRDLMAKPDSAEPASFVKRPGQFSLGRNSVLNNYDPFMVLTDSYLMIRDAYKGLVTAESMESLRQQDTSLLTLTPWRVQYGVVNIAAGYDKIPVSTVRIYEGTAGRLRSSMPMYSIIESEALQAGLGKKFDSIYNGIDDPGFLGTLKSWKLLGTFDGTLFNAENPPKVFEIGRFNVDGPIELRGRAAKALDLFLYENYLKAFPDGYFWGYVKTPAHVRHFVRNYGMELFESFTNPKSGKTEYILMGRGKAMADVVRRRFDLPN